MTNDEGPNQAQVDKAESENVTHLKNSIVDQTIDLPSSVDMPPEQISVNNVEIPEPYSAVSDEEDLHVLSDFEDVNAICNEALSLVKNVPHKVMNNYERLNQSASESDNDNSSNAEEGDEQNNCDSDKDDKEYFPPEETNSTSDEDIEPDTFST